jgi:predicted kinase
VDAVNSIDVARDMWRRLAVRHQVPLVIVECTLGDEAVHATRLAERRRGLALQEPTWPDVQARRVEWVPWTESHLTVDARDDIDVNVGRVLEELDTRSG